LPHRGDERQAAGGRAAGRVRPRRGERTRTCTRARRARSPTLARTPTTRAPRSPAA